jgi:hypothetical protein
MTLFFSKMVGCDGDGILEFNLVPTRWRNAIKPVPVPTIGGIRGIKANLRVNFERHFVPLLRFGETKGPS